MSLPIGPYSESGNRQGEARMIWARAHLWGRTGMHTYSNRQGRPDEIQVTMWRGWGGIHCVYERTLKPKLGESGEGFLEEAASVGRLRL